MALNVSFLRGTQAKLDGLTAYQAGAFYLTEDTDRLYFAQSNSELVYLNRYITTVEGTANLPKLVDVNVGDFYYVASGNILCTKATKDATQWTQINPKDTNDDTYVDSLSFAPAKENTNIKVSYTLVQKTVDVDGNVTTVTPNITGTFTITGSDIGAVIRDVALDIGASVANNATTIKLEGDCLAAGATGFTITGGEHVSITGTTDKITISAEDTTYTMSSPANTTNVVLKDSPDGTTNTVSIVQGTSNSSVNVTGVKENEIVVAHKDYTYSKAALGAQTPANAGTFNIVSGVTLENGHVTSVATNTVTLPNMSYSITKVDADADGKIYVTLSDYKGDGPAVASGQKLYYTIHGAQIYNQGSLSDYFYTKSEIDDTLKAANAMTFRGDVGELSERTELPTSNVKAGDTYIVSGDQVVIGSGNMGHKGDLFIATGDENDNGYIDSIVWVHVPAGDEINTTYTFAFVAGRGLVIHDDAAGTDTVLACVGDDTVIDVTTDGELKVTHRDVARNDGTTGSTALGSQTKFTVVTGVNSNEQGHVTGVSSVEFTMPREDVYSFDGKTANTIKLLDKDGNADGVMTINAGAKLNVTSAENAAKNGADFTVSHQSMTVSTPTAGETTLSASNSTANNTFTVVTGIENDGYGHLSKIHTTKYTMPYDSTYTFSGAVSATGTVDTIGGTATVTDTLKDRLGNSAGASTFSLKSNTMSVSANGTTITADLIWGSF